MKSLENLKKCLSREICLGFLDIFKIKGNFQTFLLFLHFLIFFPSELKEFSKSGFFVLNFLKIFYVKKFLDFFNFQPFFCFFDFSEFSKKFLLFLFFWIFNKFSTSGFFPNINNFSVRMFSSKFLANFLRQETF